MTSLLSPITSLNVNMRAKELEICCSDVAALKAAFAGGARRIELCSGLTDGGVTPSAALIAAACDFGIDNVNVLIRPRPGDFLYTRLEVSIMEHDIRHAVAAGATGIVIGALTPQGDVDTSVCSRLISAARAENSRVSITFHRAFDVARDAAEALEAVIALGCDCLLTSGMSASAESGTDTLKHLVDSAAGRIAIMAGSGVTPDNAAAIFAATNVDAIHSTARLPRPSDMLFCRSGVPMGAPGQDEYLLKVTSANEVRRLVEIVNKINLSVP